MSWLRPININPVAKIALSDRNKRIELLQEFLYYVFDSILIPLIRSNFHVTESNVYKNRLLYFRHDVWKYYTEPEISRLKSSMFEDINQNQAMRIIDSRALGVSQIRLLPKVKGVRPIMNLRRKVTKLQDGKVTLGRSINEILTPIHDMFDCERRKNPGLLGSSLFSVGDMYPKLKSYRQMLQTQSSIGSTFFFVKVDAKSCFDTIPQKAVLRLMKLIATEDVYRIARHAQIKNGQRGPCSSGASSCSKPLYKWASAAIAAMDFPSFSESIASGSARSKKNTVFVDKIVQFSKRKSKLLDTLEEHVEQNIVKIGKKFFRQKAGIPQGSVVSSLLCSYFYAELERNHLGFLQQHESLLLRLIDDFLLITTNESHAHKFLQIMHAGIEEYGVEVNPSKSLVNFTASVNDDHVPRLQDSINFPYCGNNINVRTLEITKDRDRRRETSKFVRGL